MGEQVTPVCMKSKEKSQGSKAMFQKLDDKIYK